MSKEFDIALATAIKMKRGKSNLFNGKCYSDWYCKCDGGKYKKSKMFIDGCGWIDKYICISCDKPRYDN